MRAALLIGLMACGTNAADLYAGLDVYEPRSSAYRVRYLAPPWEVTSRGMGDTVMLEVEGAVEGVPPKYQLTVDLVGRTPENRANAVARSADREDTVTGPRPVTTDSGDEGFETLIFDNSEGRYQRHVFLERDGGSVRLFFLANPNLDNDEVEAMIASAEVGPFDN